MQHQGISKTGPTVLWQKAKEMYKLWHFLAVFFFFGGGGGGGGRGTVVQTDEVNFIPLC